MISETYTYAEINAKLRARISRVLTEDFFIHLSQSRSLTEMLNSFRNTDYSEIVEIYERTGDLSMVELHLFMLESSLFSDATLRLPGIVLPLARAYAAGYEIENLKNALYLFFDHQIRKRQIDNAVHYLMRKTICCPIPFDAIIASSTYEEVAGHLAGTPYADVVNQYLPEAQSTYSLFPVSSALDRYYYAQLITAARSLEKRDRTIALRLIGIEIDLQNISWIIRFRVFYSMPFERISNYIIPDGYAVKFTSLQEIYHAKPMMANLQTVLRKTYPGIAMLLTAEIDQEQAGPALLEQLLDRIILHEVDRILSGYPFTIGILLAYFILKRHEIRRIRTVLNAGNYSINPERTAKYI